MIRNTWIPKTAVIQLYMLQLKADQSFGDSEAEGHPNFEFDLGGLFLTLNRRACKI